MNFALPADAPNTSGHPRVTDRAYARLAEIAGMTGQKKALRVAVRINAFIVLDDSNFTAIPKRRIAHVVVRTVKMNVVKQQTTSQASSISLQLQLQQY